MKAKFVRIHFKQLSKINKKGNLYKVNSFITCCNNNNNRCRDLIESELYSLRRPRETVAVVGRTSIVSH
jgi:hypothetical protein